jgi:hypothetical protein
VSEPHIQWYWDMNMIRPDRNGFWWARVYHGGSICVVKCSSNNHHQWNVARVEFDAGVTKAEMQQTMDTLLDVCRMRYADELLNQGETK